jgi:hypothetical protein
MTNYSIPVNPFPEYSYRGLARRYGTSVHVIKRWIWTHADWKPGKEQPGSEMFLAQQCCAQVDYYNELYEDIELKVGEEHAVAYDKIVNMFYWFELDLEKFMRELGEQGMDEIKSTADIRSFLSQTLRQLRNGELTPNVARTHVQAARCFLDTVKVELAASHLGKAIHPVLFSESPQVIEHKKETNDSEENT